jgi:phosphoserine phosphatase
MLIGLDFDNTIVCYDQAIVRLADELLKLPESIPRTKRDVRDYLRSADREDEWTAFQGELYGPGMRYAESFPGCLETLKEITKKGHTLCVVSHRSARPYAGPAYDLHDYARQWVAQHLLEEGIIDADVIFFYETREQKVEKIAQLACKAFIDDLPEVFAEPGFPVTTQPILFDPKAQEDLSRHVWITHDWQCLPRLIQRVN